MVSFVMPGPSGALLIVKGGNISADRIKSFAFFSHFFGGGGSRSLLIIY